MLWFALFGCGNDADAPDAQASHGVSDVFSDPSTSGTFGDADADSDADSDADADADYDGDTGAEATEETGETGDSGDTADTAVDPVDCAAEVATLYLSPDDSNSMNAALQARAALWGSANLNQVPLRTWEFFNYYTFDYPPAPDGDLAIHAALRADPDDPTRFDLQIGVSSEQMTDAERPPIHLGFVVDTSCSMGGEPLAQVAEACEEAASALRAGDRVSMTTWSNDVTILLGGHDVAGPNDPEVIAGCEAFVSDGGTNLYQGLVTGYDLIEEHLLAGATNRLVLMSDGGANLGPTSADLIALKAEESLHGGIYIAGFGVGNAGTYSDTLMDTVTDLGRGTSTFLATREDAAQLLAERFVNTFEIAQRDVHIRLDLPVGLTIVKTSAEEVSTDPKEVEPQNIAPNDAMVLYLQLRSDAPVCVTDEAVVGVGVDFRDRMTGADRTLDASFSIGELLATDQRLLRKGAATYAFVEALRAPTDDTASASARAAIDAAVAGDPADADLAELSELLGLCCE